VREPSLGHLRVLTRISHLTAVVWGSRFNGLTIYFRSDPETWVTCVSFITLSKNAKEPHLNRRVVLDSKPWREYGENYVQNTHQRTC